MKKTIVTAIFTFILLSPFSISALAGQAADSAQPVRIQDQEYVPYDQWYGPDETLDDVEDDRTESVVIPEAPDSDERVAPEEDTRPQAR